MKKSRGLLTAVLTAAMAATMLSGCSSGGTKTADTGTAAQTAAKQEEQNKGTPTADGEKTKITIWTVDRHDAAFMQSKVDEYNAANTDNIVVEYELYTENYVQAVDMAFQNNTPPDIMKQHEVLFPKYVGSGKFVDLGTYMTDAQKETYKSTLFQGINVIDDKIYYIPTTGTTGRLFYNKEIFETCGIAKAPETLEEMLEVSRKITAQLSGEGVYGFASNLKSPTSALSRSLNFMMERQEGLRAGFDFAKGEYDFGRYADTLKIWRDLFATDSAFPGCESLDIDPLRTQFAAGKIGMYISWTHAEPGVYKNQFPMDESKWGCVELPTLSGQVKGKQDYVLGNGMLLNADGANKDAAWKVYEAIWLNEDTLAEYYEAGLGISTIQSVIEKADASEIYKNNPALLIGDNDKVWPLSPQEKDSSVMIVEGLDMYSTFGAMILGELDIDKGIADLTKRYNDSYQKAVSSGAMQELKVDGFDPMNPTK